MKNPNTKTAPTLPHRGGNAHAFTLAEVLITLGVIGVVAAMTMPTLIQNYKDRVQLTQFRKTYSAISNAFRMVEAKNGYIPICKPADSTECLTLYEELSKQMKILKKCTTNAYQNGCVPYYNDKNDNYVNPACPFYKAENIRNLSYAIVLSDGSIMFSYYKVANSSTYNGNHWFGIDINGFKGPNKWGYDLFPLAFSNETSAKINNATGGCAGSAPGGKYVTEMLTKI